MIRKVRLRRS